MKSVLISIQPKWVEKITSGEKTIEVRKSRPNIETPFKCYIYCTKKGNLWQMNASVFCIEVTQDGGLVDETLKECIGGKNK